MCISLCIYLSYFLPASQRIVSLSRASNMRVSLWRPLLQAMRSSSFTYSFLPPPPSPGAPTVCRGHSRHWGTTVTKRTKIMCHVSMELVPLAETMSERDNCHQEKKPRCRDGKQWRMTGSEKEATLGGELSGGLCELHDEGSRCSGQRGCHFFFLIIKVMSCTFWKSSIF